MNIKIWGLESVGMLPVDKASFKDSDKEIVDSYKDFDNNIYKNFHNSFVKNSFNKNEYMKKVRRQLLNATSFGKNSRD